MTAQLSSAELKTLREGLGLSIEFCAANVGGVAVRSWKYWETGERTIPADVADQILAMDAAVRAQVNQAVQLALKQRAKHGKPESVDLLTFRNDTQLRAHHETFGFPASHHRSMIFRCRDALIAAGFSVAIGYPD